MDEEPEVILMARNEGLEVRANGNIYWFDVCLDRGVWRVGLPPRRLEMFVSGGRDKVSPLHELSEAEAAVILPAIQRSLSRIYWFGLLPRSYEVSFERGVQFNLEKYLAGMHRQGWTRENGPDGSVRMMPPARSVLLARLWRRIWPE